MSPGWRWGLLAMLIAAVMVAGCAGQQAKQANRDGLQLIADGQIEAGLAKLEQAAREAPANTEYRSTLFRQRDLAVGQLLAQADALRAANNAEQAEANYRRVLGIDPVNSRAKAGIEAVGMDKRHRAQVAEAEALFSKGNSEGAQARLRVVLAEDPNQRDARALERRLIEAKLKETLAAKDLSPGFRKPVTLEFREANLRTVFEVLSRSTGINFVFDKDVRTDLRTTIFVRNKNLDETIKILLLTNQLAQKVIDDNTIIIYPDTSAKVRDYQEMVVKAFYLANADATQVLNSIRSVVKTRDIIIDDKLNMVVMRDTAEAVRMAEKLVALQDQPDPEVVLELEVMEVNTTRLQELGFRYPEQVTASVQGAAGVAGSLTLPEYLNRNANLVQLKITNPALIANLRKLDTDAQLLANPRVRVRNRDKARVHIGEKVPVITNTATATGLVAESVTYLDIGLKLEIESNIYLDNEVAMKLGLEVSNILDTITRASGTVVYRIGTRNAATTLRLKDGETQMLAGLISNEDRRTANKVPGLGDLPIVGRLFTNNLDNKVKTEIVLLITPRIVRNIVRPDAQAAEFAAGTDSRLGGSGSSGGGAPGFPQPPQPPPQQQQPLRPQSPALQSQPLPGVPSGVLQPLPSSSVLTPTTPFR